ncbi:hypothetical protein D3C75_1136720 [compost metagenome]
MRIFYSGFAVFAGNKFRNELHRARAVQREHRDDILEARRLQILQHTPDAR